MARAARNDFFTSVPSGPTGEVETVTVTYSGTTQDFHVGNATVAVPGCLDGFLQAHRTYGIRPLAQVVGPAITLARDGIRLEPAQAHAMALIEGVLMLTAESRSRMAPGGTLLGAGEFFVDASMRGSCSESRTQR